jgi:hypothetical protein
MLSRESLFSRAPDLPRVKVFIREWDETIYVRALTAAERDRYEIALSDTKGANYKARLVAMCACDEAGRNLFTDHDVIRLGQEPATAIQRAFDAAQKLSKLTNDAIEELAKNSEPAPSDASSSA